LESSSFFCSPPVSHLTRFGARFMRQHQRHRPCISKECSPWRIVSRYRSLNNTASKERVVG
jgi:hypothetical protein